MRRRGAWCAAGVWTKSARQCRMNVNGRVLRSRTAQGVFARSVNMLNRMLASSALSRNGRLDGAGMAKGPWPVGFGSETDVRGESGERREVEHTKRNETRGVITLDHDLHDFESFRNQGITRKKTEACVGSPFGGPKLAI
jgi:hypothetical protein